MKINQKPKSLFTKEGGRASIIKPIDELRRTVMACMLWENNFYEAGEDLALRIKNLVPNCLPNEIAELAIKARKEQHLRHVPLLLVRELARHPSHFLIADTLCEVIQRADELSEFLAIYWSEEKTKNIRARNPLSKQIKKGLAKAFQKFNEYELAKYNRADAITLRDVLFMIHAKPKDEGQAQLWNRLVDNKLAIPDTWEVALSSGLDKKEVFTRLLNEKKLGYLALLRNLRNMQEAQVDSKIVFSALLEGATKTKALPFRYVAAARAVPAWEPQIDQAMQMSLESMQKLSGKTIILIDVSGSMDSNMSGKSDLKSIDAASALAVLVNGICDEARIFTFSDKLVEVPRRSGMALIDAIIQSQPHNGTNMGSAISSLHLKTEGDRLIVFTDEQSADTVGKPIGKGYIINVATYQNGVGYGDWTHINGFSEAVINYISAYEKEIF